MTNVKKQTIPEILNMCLDSILANSLSKYHLYKYSSNEDETINHSPVPCEVAVVLVVVEPAVVEVAAEPAVDAGVCSVVAPGVVGVVGTVGVDGVVLNKRRNDTR